MGALQKAFQARLRKGTPGPMVNKKPVAKGPTFAGGYVEPGYMHGRPGRSHSHDRQGGGEKHSHGAGYHPPTMTKPFHDPTQVTSHRGTGRPGTYREQTRPVGKADWPEQGGSKHYGDESVAHGKQGSQHFHTEMGVGRASHEHPRQSHEPGRTPYNSQFGQHSHGNTKEHNHAPAPAAHSHGGGQGKGTYQSRKQGKGAGGFPGASPRRQSAVFGRIAGSGDGSQRLETKHYEGEQHSHQGRLGHGPKERPRPGEMRDASLGGTEPFEPHENMYDSGMGESLGQMGEGIGRQGTHPQPKRKQSYAAIGGEGQTPEAGKPQQGGWRAIRSQPARSARQEAAEERMEEMYGPDWRNLMIKPEDEGRMETKGHEIDRPHSQPKTGKFGDSNSPGLRVGAREAPVTPDDPEYYSTARPGSRTNPGRAEPPYPGFKGGSRANDWRQEPRKQGKATVYGPSTPHDKPHGGRLNPQETEPGSGKHIHTGSPGEGWGGVRSTMAHQHPMRSHPTNPALSHRAFRNGGTRPRTEGGREPIKYSRHGNPNRFKPGAFAKADEPHGGERGGQGRLHGHLGPGGETHEHDYGEHGSVRISPPSKDYPENRRAPGYGGSPFNDEHKRKFGYAVKKPKNTVTFRTGEKDTKGELKKAVRLAVKAVVAKHGTHDQSTHGSKAKGHGMNTRQKDFIRDVLDAEGGYYPDSDCGHCKKVTRQAKTLGLSPQKVQDLYNRVRFGREGMERHQGKAVSPHNAPFDSDPMSKPHTMRIARQNAKMPAALRGVMGGGDLHEHRGQGAHSHPDAWDADDNASHTHKALRKDTGSSGEWSAMRPTGGNPLHPGNNVEHGHSANDRSLPNRGVQSRHSHAGGGDEHHHQYTTQPEYHKALRKSDADWKTHIHGGFEEHEHGPATRNTHQRNVGSHPFRGLGNVSCDGPGCGRSMGDRVHHGRTEKSLRKHNIKPNWGSSAYPSGSEPHIHPTPNTSIRKHSGQPPHTTGNVHSHSAARGGAVNMPYDDHGDGPTGRHSHGTGVGNSPPKYHSHPRMSHFPGKSTPARMHKGLTDHTKAEFLRTIKHPNYDKPRGPKPGERVGPTGWVTAEQQGKKRTQTEYKPGEIMRAVQLAVKAVMPPAEMPEMDVKQPQPSWARAGAAERERAEGKHPGKQVTGTR